MLHRLRCCARSLVSVGRQAGIGYVMKKGPKVQRGMSGPGKGDKDVRLDGVKTQGDGMIVL